MSKPSLLLDVDGVLADFVSGALRVLRDISGDTIDPNTITTWEMFDSIQESHKHYREAVYHDLKGPGGCSSLPVYSGAQEGVARLRELCDVTIVTSPFYGSKTWMHERERWLEQHFGIHHHDIIHADKKFRVHGDVFVDDKPSHLHAWSDYWIGMGRDKRVQPVLWDSLRNTNEVVGAGVARVKNWDELITLLKRGFVPR